MILYGITHIAWYSLNIVLIPLLLSVSAAARDRQGPPYRCTAGIHLPGRTPPSPSPPYRCDTGGHVQGRTPPSHSPPYSIEQKEVSNKIPYLVSRKVTNKEAHTKYGNIAGQGKPIRICYWNKASSFLSNKKDDIAEIINTHKPLVLGLGEAQFKQGQNIEEVQQPGYTLHMDSCQDSPGVSRCAVYTHNSLVVKRQDDLENKEIATVWLQLGLPNQKGILVMCGLPGRPDSGSVAAQRERWGKLIS